MAGPLDGLTVLIPESRELDLFATMLESEGATAWRCPLVRILDLEDTTDAEAWIDRLIAQPFQDVIWFTGEGLRRLTSLAHRQGRREAFIAAVARVRSITRGPKPAHALRELGLSPGLAAATPTSEGILESLSSEDIRNRKIGVQLYPGEGTKAVLDALRERGANIFAVTPYRYATQADSASVVDAIHALADGRIGMIAFTSSPQVERLIEVAQEAGLEPQLKDALARIRVAAVGPVVEEALRRYGAVDVIRPQANFHLKPLVRAIVTAHARNP